MTAQQAGKREVDLFLARSLRPLLWTLLLAECIRESPQSRLQLQPPSLWIPATAFSSLPSSQWG